MIVTPTEISGEDRPESDMRRPQRVGSPAALLGDPSAVLRRKLVQASVFDANASAGERHSRDPPQGADVAPH
jgi:hypothetical protein